MSSTAPSALGVAGTVAFEVLPVLLLGPLVGLLVDRYPRRGLMVLADLVRALLALLIAIAGDSVGLAYGVAFGLSAFYTGVAGGLFAFLVGFLSPDAFDVFLSVDFVVMIIVGGLGSVPGSIIGATVVTLLHDGLAAFQNYRPLIFGAILIACMLFMPGGMTRALARVAGR